MPLINRVGGGGADVSGVTAVAADVVEGKFFVKADGELSEGALRIVETYSFDSKADNPTVSTFALGNYSDGGLVFKFKFNADTMVPQGGEIWVYVYRSTWDEHNS